MSPILTFISSWKRSLFNIINGQFIIHAIAVVLINLLTTFTALRDNINNRGGIIRAILISYGSFWEKPGMDVLQL